MSVADKLNETGPRKLLTIDGGGIRGMLSIEILAEIESLLRDAHHNDSLRLCDYYDYVAGTSTGAIIATGISWGMEVSELRQFYKDNGAEMFEKENLWNRITSLGAHSFRDDNLARQLQEVFGEKTTLGTDKLKTLLMVVLRNATTDSPWPLSNNPQAKYNDRRNDDCNLDLPLWQIVRASTAAPTYFPPETVTVGTQQFVFVDGGVTMYNNPAFQLFKMATLEPYYLNWNTGEEQMLLTSVGTGYAAEANDKLQPDEMNLIYNASSIPSALMSAALHEQDELCRVFGNCRVAVPEKLDSELGDLMSTRVPGMDKKLFTYLRYNAELTKSGLSELGISDIDPQHVQQMDSVKFIEQLQAVGQAVAEQHVRKEHFEGFLPN